MGDLGNEAGEQGGLDAWARRSSVVPGRADRPRRSDRDSRSTGVWRRPVGEAVPTRSIEGDFGFSRPDEEVRPDREAGEIPEARLAEARSRAFRKLDEWLTWIYVLDDESIFPLESTGRRMEPYRFVLGDVITEPVDVLRYSLKTTSLLF